MNFESQKMVIELNRSVVEIFTALIASGAHKEREGASRIEDIAFSTAIRLMHRSLDYVRSFEGVAERKPYETGVDSRGV